MPDREAHPDQRRCQFGPVEITHDPRVLTPRPWTLAQSEWAAQLATDLPEGPLLELCAGAGQIGLAAAALSGRRLVQVDADPVAVGYARANAETAGLGGRVEVRHARIDEALDDDERFPLVLADPPYLPRGEVGLFPDDPLTAIDGGPDGLDLVRTCLAVAAAHLVTGGLVVLQVRGPGQVAEVEALPPHDAGALEVVDRRVVDEDRALALLAPRAG